MTKPDHRGPSNLVVFVFSLVLSQSIHGILFGDMLLMRSGEKRPGNFLLYERNQVYFKYPSGLTAILPREGVTGVFTTGFRNPPTDSGGKDMLIVGKKQSQGSLYAFCPISGAAIINEEGSASPRLFQSSQTFQAMIFHKDTPPTLEEDAIDTLGQKVLTSLKKHRKKKGYLNGVIALGSIYLHWSSDGRYSTEIEKQVDSLKESRKKQLSKMFSIDRVVKYDRLKFGGESGHRQIMIFNIRSKLSSFTDLGLTISAQLADGTVYSSRFSCYSTKKVVVYRSSVFPRRGAFEFHGEIVRHRIALDYLGVEIVETFGGKRSRDRWWETDNPNPWDTFRLGTVVNNHSNHSLARAEVDGPRIVETSLTPVGLCSGSAPIEEETITIPPSGQPEGKDTGKK